MQKTAKPLISIVMAAYNEEKNISKAVDSIITQTFTEWELIVIDDGSSDRTKSIIEEFERKDSRIQLITNKKNLGLPESLNRGINLARASLIARTDADDINLPQRLQKQYSYLQSHPDIEIVGTAAYLIDKNGQKVKFSKLPLTQLEFISLSFLKIHFFHPSVLIRKSFFDKVGLYDPLYIRTEDKELWLRGLSKGCHYANISEPLIEYSTDGYVRSWRTIFNRARSSLLLVRAYRVKKGRLLIILSTVNLILIKMRIRKPASLRKNK